MQLWVRVPLSARAAADEEEDGDREGREAGGGGAGMDGEEGGEGMEEEEDGGGERPLRGAPLPSTAAASAREDPWETWNRLRTLCEFNASLGVVLGTCVGVNGMWGWITVSVGGARRALTDRAPFPPFHFIYAIVPIEMTEDLPAREVLQRWRGEPIRAVIFPTSIFLTNKKGYPVLSKVNEYMDGCDASIYLSHTAPPPSNERWPLPPKPPPTPNHRRTSSWSSSSSSSSRCRCCSRGARGTRGATRCTCNT